VLLIVDLIVLLCFAVQFAIAGYYFYLLYWLSELPPAEEGTASLPDDLPRVLVQLPVFNEPTVVERALSAAGALDWPRDRLKIQLLDDSTDLTSDIAVHAIARLRRDGIDAEHVRRSDRTGFKAGALEAGMALDDAPYVAVFDADFVPPPDWLKRTMAAMLAHPKAAFVQTRIEWGNGAHNALTRTQRLMQDAHFAVEQDVRARRGVPFQFNGTGGIWRRAAIEAAGGWLGDSLCEDLDLTIRAELADWHGVFLMEPAVPGLVPDQLGHWRVQQRRWSNGFVQVARKLLGEVWGSHWTLGRKISASALILIQAFYPCAATATLSLMACIVLRGFNIVPYLPVIEFLLVLIAIVAGGMTLVPYLILRRGSFWRYLVTVVAVPPMMVYMSVSNAPSILKTVFSGSRESFMRTPKSRQADAP
jgi:cellulose synthase/poly-beta-1,6-N-acetylglucosamine synthase-like glycosyltransferase